MLLGLLFATGAYATGLSGTYSIDASGSGNYTTFAAAVSDLGTYGVAGAVTFNVTAATYTEKVSIGAITGASSSNTITFHGKGRGNTVLTSTGVTLTMSGKYITFDGMTISNGSSNLVNATNSTNCGLTNCNLTSTGTSNTLVVANSSVGLTVYNCYIYGGEIGLNMQGSYGTATYGYMRISHNRFINQSTEYCIFDEYGFKDSFAFNVLDSQATSYLYDGFECIENDGIIIWGNKVFVDAEEALYLDVPDYAPVAGNPTHSQVVNNEIVSLSGGSNQYEPVELYIENCDGFVYAYNTYIGEGTLDYDWLYFYGATNVVFANNIFDNISGGIYNFYLYAYNGTSFALYDGNDMYGTGSSGLCYYYNGSTGSVLSSYSNYATTMKANGWETHGTNVAPPFISTSIPYNLDMNLTTAAANKGVSGIGITTDINSKGRFPTPTAGASESYYGIVNNNAGVTALISPIAQCPGTVTVSVQVSNLGLNAINGSSTNTIAWTWNGVAQTPVTYTTSIPLYSSITVTLGTETLVSGTPNTLKAWPTQTNGLTNAGGKNDTLNVTGILAALGGGKYTIDGTKATSGTNFKSFTAAVTALNAGICGPILFNVTAATYNESVTIGTVGGASTTNTVIFHGAGRAKTTLTNGSTPVTLNGSSYVTFDNMTISTTGSGTVNVIKDAGSNYCHFMNDNLSAPKYSTNTGTVVLTNGTGLKVHNCRIVGAEYSINTSAKFDTFTNNRIIYTGYYGIYSNSKGNDFEYNVLDSVVGNIEYGIYSDPESGCTWNANYIHIRTDAGVQATAYAPTYIIEPNMSTITDSKGNVIPWTFTNNIIQSNCTQYDLWEFINAKGLCNMSFNTFEITGGYEAVEGLWESNNANTQIFASNVYISNSSVDYGFYVYTSSPGFVSGVSNWDNGDTLYDGNDMIVNTPALYWGYTPSGTGSSYSQYIAWAHGNNYERHGTSVTPPFIDITNNLYLDTTKAAPQGVYTGVDYDITGRKRCKLFPTAGAFEDPYGKAPKATKIFLPATGIYPGSPSTIYQSHVAGDPAIYVWYIKNSNYSTWTPISTTVNLYYSGWTTGTDSLKLVTTSCNGNDSARVGFTVTAPSAVPATDFIAASNAIQQNTADQLTDLSTNGPTKWLWAITPDSITVGTTKQPTTNQAGLSTTQNPNITFYYPGYYKVCLTAYNGLGKGAITCKTNYIQVVPATILSTVPQTVSDPTGYIYDNGGPGTGGVGNYTAVGSPYIESVLIQPCADSVYLTFSQFDTKCSYDFVKLYNGASPVASSQINTSCTGGGTSGGGPGFNGGPTNGGCSTYCIPNVNRPDTFKSGPKMLLTMYCYSGGAPGFAAYYWVKPSSDKRVVPSFTTANGIDSVCAGQLVTYKNTTKIDPKDVPSFEWDLNGDISDGFECVGTCATAQWPYFLPGTVPVTLIATNCGGADTIVKNITVISPPKPVAAFSANIVAPTITDVVTFTSGTVQCVDAYLWKITASAGTVGGAAAVFVNGTSDSSASPMVTFPDSGYYDVSLTVTNASGTQTNTKTILKYIHARVPYCQPSVAQLSSGIGINHVVFNTINNFTTPQASQGYLNFTANSSLSTTIAIGASYNLSVSRDHNSIFSPINRDAWIDWNEDGSFVGTGENVLKDSNTTAETSTAKITVPTTAKVGATILRIAVNLYLYPNAPCGANQFGEYEDYRVYVTPYNILPVITLKGKDTITVEQGYPYSEPGDSASSYLYGDITSSIKATSRQVIGLSIGASFSILVPGTYVFDYNVTDPAGNKAITQHRVVVVTPDKTAPNLILAKNSVSGTDTIFQEVSTASVPPNLNPSLRSYVVSSFDLVDGDLKGSVSVDSSLVQLNVVGVYPVTYTSTDLSKNTASRTLYVDVIDTIKPVLTMLPPNPDTIQVNVPFVDPGVTVSVANGYLSKAQLIKYLHVTSSVNDSLLGTYKVTYSLTDTFGNVAKSVTRIVVVADKLPPVLTLLGPVHDSVLVNNTYYDRGYTVSDIYYTKAGGVKVTMSGTFVTAFKSNYANKLGGGKDSNKVVDPLFGTTVIGPAYRITYTAVNGSGLKATATRYIEVYDNIAPSIALIGEPSANICRWFPYTDAGYTVSDNYTDSAHINVTKTGTVFSQGTSLGNRTVDLKYTAEDQAGNMSSVVRTIYVIPETDAACASGIAPSLALDKSITVFPNPGAGIFNVEANLPASQNVRISVMNMLGQEITVVHDGSLMHNSFRVDLSNQASGVYFLNIVSNNQSLTKRIEIAK